MHTKNNVCVCGLMGPHRGGVGESDLGVSGKEIRIKGNEFLV